MSFATLNKLKLHKHVAHYHSLPALAKKTGKSVSRLPRSLRVLLENLLRHEDGDIVRAEDIEALLNWQPQTTSSHEIQYTPARVLLQDFTGVPVVADLAAMRSEISRRQGDAQKINPVQPVDLVIDHSVQVDAFGTPEAFATNSRYEFERNRERYEFLKWGQKAFANFRVVPPATGICHQVNLEYLSQVAMRITRDNKLWVIPDTLVGTDSHTPMVNGLGVLGWGVGGIEAEAAMLAQPCSMLIPDVIGFELTGTLEPGVTATDLVLTITQMLRKKGVVGKFVEFTGAGVASLAIADRATISNMAPEYGATVGYWPVDAKTVDYLKLTGRQESAAWTELYYQSQQMMANGHSDEIEFSDKLSLDLKSVQPSVAGPSKPHDRFALGSITSSFSSFLKEQSDFRGGSRPKNGMSTSVGRELTDGSLVIAAITSCTNTSNPRLMLGAALLARNARKRNLTVPPWVKTSFAPGSVTVTRYIQEAGLMPDLESLGFHLVGYGCTTCIGNSGPLPPEIADEIDNRQLTVAAVLSGNRNFEARIHPLVRANYLASPPLVVAFALAGRVDIDLTQAPLGHDDSKKPVYLRDLWPNSDELDRLVAKHVTAQQYSASYADVFKGDERWQQTSVTGGEIYDWQEASTYIKEPPFFESEYTSNRGQPSPLVKAKILALFGDFITTDHISPAGAIGASTPAGQYLSQLGVAREDFNSYGARRGNHEVMMRGTFANVRLRNQMVNREGGYTRHWPSGEETTIYEAAMRYKESATPLIILAGKEYGSGSSRDWAAKGTRLLGVRAVMAESFERIHRSNLIGMGVLPLEFTGNEGLKDFQLVGHETLSIENLDSLKPKSTLKVKVEAPKGGSRSFNVLCRIDTANELRYYKAGGILPYVLSASRVNTTLT